jgi:hypothetical protein
VFGIICKTNGHDLQLSGDWTCELAQKYKYNERTSAQNISAENG